MAIQYDGSADYLKFTGAAATTWPITLGCWFNRDVTTSDDVPLCISQDNTNSQAFRIRTVGGIKTLAYDIQYGPQVSLSASGTWNTGTWYFACGRSTANNDHKVWLGSGTGTSTSTATSPSSPAVTVVGAGNGGGTAYFDGGVAYAFVYDVALTDEEVTALSNGVSPLLIRPQSLKFFDPGLNAGGVDWAGGRSVSVGNAPALTDFPKRIIWPANQTIIIPAAGGATTKTKTTSLDSLLKKANNLKTTSIDALLQKTQSVQASIDAALKQTLVKTTDIDAILSKLGITKTTSLDALLQKTLTKTISLDAILQATAANAITTQLDAALYKSGLTKTASIDALLQKTLTKSTTMDALLQQTLTLTTSIDSLLKATITKTTSMDAVIIGAGTNIITTSLDALLKKTLQLTLSVDALLRKNSNLLTSSFDSVVLKRGLLTSQLDAILRKIGITVTISIDSVITSPDQVYAAGLEYTLYDDNIDYTFNFDKLHYTLKGE